MIPGSKILTIFMYIVYLIEVEKGLISEKHPQIQFVSRD